MRRRRPARSTAARVATAHWRALRPLRRAGGLRSSRLPTATPPPTPLLPLPPVPPQRSSTSRSLRRRSRATAQASRSSDGCPSPRGSHRHRRPRRTRRPLRRPLCRRRRRLRLLPTASRHRGSRHVRDRWVAVVQVVRSMAVSRAATRVQASVSRPWHGQQRRHLHRPRAPPRPPHPQAHCRQIGRRRSTRLAPHTTSTASREIQAPHDPSCFLPRPHPRPRRFPRRRPHLLPRRCLLPRPRLGRRRLPPLPFR